MVNTVCTFFFLLLSIIILFKIKLGIEILLIIKLLIPFQMIRLSFGDPFIYLTCIVLVSYFYHNRFILRENHKEVKYLNTISKPIIIYTICAIFLTFFATVDFNNALYSQCKTCVDYFAIPFVIWMVFREKKDIRCLFYIILVCCIIMNIYSLFCYMIQSNPYIVFMELIFNPESSFLTYFSETDRGFFLGRQQSTVIHPQTWLSIVSLFLFYILLLVFQYKKWNKILLIGLLGGLMFNLITGGSRSGLIAGLIGLTFVFFHTNVKSQIKIGTSLISLIFICTCILPLTFHDSILDYVKSIIFIANDKYSIEGSSLSLREEQLNGCWSLIKENPLTGNGFGWVTDYLNIHKEHPVLWGFESLLFFALVDTGIIGLFNWCLLFYGLFKVNIVILKKYNITNRYMKGILNGHLIAIVVFLFVCGNFFSLWFFFISYVILLKFICIEYGRFNNYC